jgi:hypothetical protein
MWTPESGGTTAVFSYVNRNGGENPSSALADVFVYREACFDTIAVLFSYWI